ncbi:hypothetical protein BH10PSE3_BH10PSE3_09340 [soil metagenome]
MDHTPVDNVVVMNIGQRLPMGRPTLTILIDVRTRCVVGWVVSYEPSSLYSATECIKRASRPKLALLAGASRYRPMANIFGRFDEIVVDNGKELTQGDNPIIFVNSAFQALTGFRSEEIPGHSLKHLVQDNADTRVLAQIDAAFEDYVERELKLQRNDGADLWVSLFVSPVSRR